MCFVANCNCNCSEFNLFGLVYYCISMRPKYACVCVYNVYAKTESFSLYTKIATTYFHLFHLVPSNGRSMKTEPLDGVDSISRWILLTTTAICRVVHISFNLIKKDLLICIQRTHAPKTKQKFTTIQRLFTKKCARAY